MCVDVIDLGCRDTGIGQCLGHDIQQACAALLIGRGQVVGVVVDGPAQHLGVHLGVAPHGRFPGLQHQHAGAFTKDGTVPIFIERPAEVGRNCAQYRKAGQRRKAQPIVPTRQRDFAAA